MVSLYVFNTSGSADHVAVEARLQLTRLGDDHTQQLQLMLAPCAVASGLPESWTLRFDPSGIDWQNGALWQWRTEEEEVRVRG